MYHYTTIPFPKHPKTWGKHQSIHFLRESHGEITITFACRWRTICKACPITLSPQNRWLHHARKEHNSQIESCMYTSVLMSKNTKSWMLFFSAICPIIPNCCCFENTNSMPYHPQIPRDRHLHQISSKAAEKEKQFNKLWSAHTCSYTKNNIIRYTVCSYWMSLFSLISIHVPHWRENG